MIMSDFNPLDRAKIAVHRSSFDLSSKKLFTAKIGEILPVYWQIAIPGNKYRISSDWFTRTVPVNTAAYTRIKEYYDFYAVPLRLISRALPQAFTQMTDYMTSAASNTANTEMLTSVPNTTLNLLSLSLQTINGQDVFDDAGLPYCYGASKILDMLGYGSFLESSNKAKQAITKAYLGKDNVNDAYNPLVYSVSQTVNLLPLLAYQKIYYDFFSESQWEKHLAYAYNVDYWDGKSQLILAPEMLQLRYANYPKDYFMGMLPNSQYGSVAVMPSLTNIDPSNVVVLSRNSTGSLGGSVGRVSNVSSSTSLTSTNTDTSSRYAYVNSNLSALSIRATEYLQRWKEVVQFASKDYSDQMRAQFGIKAPEYMGNHAHYIGGWSNVININEVLNTNLQADGSQAVIAGKGVGSQSGHTLTYDCGAEHQVIMCVYHAVPMVDWNLTGQNPQLTVTAITDFPQPAFDQLGMQPVPALNLQNNPSRKVSGSIGYNLRYWQWKTNIDTVHAAFRSGMVYQSWAAPIDGWDVLTSSGAWSYRSMKVRPQQLNSIFEPQVSGDNCSVAYDQLLCNVSFQVYAVQNLDRNGLPY
nr:MAG: major capsid protein [Microvirus sp.]